MMRLPAKLDRAEMSKLYDMLQGTLRPAYDRLAEAHLIKRDPVTDEISFPPTDIVSDLRKMGLL